MNACMYLDQIFRPTCFDHTPTTIAKRVATIFTNLWTTAVSTSVHHKLMDGNEDRSESSKLDSSISSKLFSLEIQ